MLSPGEGNIYAGSAAYSARLVEITDGHDSPLLLMGGPEAEAQNLAHRWVLVILRRRDGRIWLARRARKPGEPELWDFSVRGPVHAGEARESAALRLLHEQIGVEGVRPVPRAAAQPPITEGAKRMALFVAEHRNARFVPVSGAGMFLDEDEVTGLAEHFPELFEPCLLHCISACLRELFRGRGEAAARRITDPPLKKTGR